MNNLSIIIPYYKGENYIFNCIDSIFESYNLSQKKISFEIIIVIDSPEEYRDNNVDILSHYEKSVPIQIIINEKNTGVAASRNKGCEASRYNLITFIDQDDQVCKNYFSVIENNLDDIHSCFIYNGFWHFMSKNRYEKLYHIKPDISFNSLAKQHFNLWTPGLMITDKTKIKKQFIDVSENYKGCDDFAANLDMALNYESICFKYIKTPIFIINRHDHNFSNNIAAMCQCDIETFNYFESKTKNKKQKTIIRNMIEIKQFLLDRIENNLQLLQILKNYKRIYLKYLCNKWGYLSFPEYKLKKILYLYFGKHYLD